MVHVPTGCGSFVFAIAPLLSIGDIFVQKEALFEPLENMNLYFVSSTAPNILLKIWLL